MHCQQNVTDSSFVVDSAQIRAARFAAKLSAMKRKEMEEEQQKKNQVEDTEASRKAEKEQRLKNIEAMLFDQLAQDQLEVMKKRGTQKAVSKVWGVYSYHQGVKIGTIHCTFMEVMNESVLPAKT